MENKEEFMFWRKNYHQQTYQRNKDGAFKILVALHKYEDVYSDWDPSPFKRRDIEEDFIEYIWDSALDIPINEDMVIVFLVEESLRDDKKEQHLIKALNNHFVYSLNKVERRYFEEKKKSLRYLIIGIVFAFFAYSNIFVGVDLWTKIFEEGIIIGTWVFFWEAFYDLFIECRSFRQEIKLIKKFLKTDCVFRNKI